MAAIAERETYLSQEWDRVAKTFYYFSLGGGVFQVGYKEVPQAALREFEWRRSRYVHSIGKPDWQALFLITHPESDVATWAAWYTNSPHPFQGIETTQCFFDSEIWEGDTDHTHIGSGEIVFSLLNPKPFFSVGPYAEWLGTEDKHRHRGHATRRLIFMNALSQATFGYPIHAELEQMIDRKKGYAYQVWERLRLRGLVKRYKNPEGKIGYVFSGNMNDYQHETLSAAISSRSS